MPGSLLLLLALATPQDLQVSAEVERERLVVGEALTYTVRVIVERDLPVRATPGAFEGFTLLGAAERREPAGAPAGAEVLVLEYRLRAQRVGLWRLGGVAVEQGIRSVRSPDLEVAVEPGRPAPGPQLGPRVDRLLARAAAPAAGAVAVTLLVSSDTVVVGQQVDVVTAAWFPRDLLARLRRPPTIRPPTVPGVYSAVQPSAAGVAASRLVGGTWYDIYVAHQILFPVDAGVVRIPEATLSYAVPSGRQYFAEEQPQERSSAGRALVVQGLPPGGPGAVGAGMALVWELPAEPARAGQPMPVSLVLSGRGNIALWPAPALKWPEGSRGYVDGATDAPRVEAGEFGGLRRFRYLAVVDSAGTLALPDVRYRYYDLAQGAWREATPRPVVLPVLPASPTSERRAPAPLPEATPLGLWRVTPVVAAALGLLLLLPPAILALGPRAPGRRRRTLVAPAGEPAEDLVARVRALVPDADARREDRLAAALRSAGVDAALAVEVAGLYGHLANRRFAPGGVGATASLTPAVRRALAGWPRRLTFVAVLALAPGGASPGAAQTSDPVVRWAEGAVAWETGQDARAAAAWIGARRLAPRNPAMREGWRRLAGRSADLQAAGRVFPLTPVELAVVATLGWALGWVAVARRRRTAAWISFIAAGVAGLAGAVVAREYARPLAIVSRGAIVRQVPHGLAPEAGTADPLSVVALVSSQPGWRLVRTAAGLVGWLPESALVPVRE